MIETKIRTAKLRLRLEEILKEQGRKKKWVAEQLEVSTQAVKTWCGKKHCPNSETLSKIAELLAIKRSELFERNEGWSKFLPPLYDPVHQ